MLDRTILGRPARHPLARRTRTLCVALTLSLAAATAAPVALAGTPDPLWTDGTSAQRPLSPDAPVSMRAFADLAKELTPSVVNIMVKRKARGPGGGRLERFFGREGIPMPEGSGVGSGFIIHADGFVLTNHHVIDGATHIELKLASDAIYPAQVVGSYPQLDVALLRFEPKERLKVASLGDSVRLDIGEWVIAIGNPFGLDSTVTAGIVSAKGRRDVSPGSQPMYANFIQTDASINPGNSGGPLINIRGEVIGINTAINAAGQGIGFAVPIHMVKTILPQLAQGRVERSYLGVKVGPVDRSLAPSLGLNKAVGALVHEVMDGTPASAAGILPGDVVLKWADQSITHWEDLPWLASTAGDGAKVGLTVRRGRKNVALSVVMAAFPGAPVAGRGPSTERHATPAPPDDGVGVTVSDLSATDRRGLRLSGSEGVKVEAIAEGSRARVAGLRVGDVVTRVGYAPVASVREFYRELAKVADGDTVSLHVLRGERRLFMAFTR